MASGLAAAHAIVLVVVSPHLDDAVFGCGALLARAPGATIVTVCAGTPALAASTAWDTACGFADSAEAIAARRAEDRRAAHLVGAASWPLAFLDAQYRAVAPGPPRDDEAALEAAVADALATPLRQLAPSVALYPLGLFHADHRRVHRGAGSALERIAVRASWAYEDAIYRAIPGVLQRRLAELEAAGVRARPLRLKPATAAEHAAKARAAAAYASQWRALGERARADVAAPERYWHLSVRHDG